MKALFLISLIGITLSSCSHFIKRGSVAMKISKTKAHVSLGQNEAKIGDKVLVFINTCPPLSARDAQTSLCHKDQVGTGTVVKILNEHYSVVEFDKGINFSEGNFVEIQE